VDEEDDDDDVEALSFSTDARLRIRFLSASSFLTFSSLILSAVDILRNCVVVCDLVFLQPEFLRNCVAAEISCAVKVLF